MRLKTLRKERPAFENEGAVINGSRMDLSNSEYKPLKHRTNNTFALPTSLNNEVSSLSIYPSNSTNEINTNHPQQTSTRRLFHRPVLSQPTHITPYQAIEAAYLEHGIRIHLNPTTAAAVTQQQSQTIEISSRGKSASSIQRHKAFANRIPSRSSSALHYSNPVPDSDQQSRPFSALQHASTTDFDQTNTHNVSYTQKIENQRQLNDNYCSSSIVASEHSDHVILPPQIAITNGTTSSATLIDNDPDFAYMSSLLQTTNGNSFRDTIRRRAGLRATFAVHRHPQPTTTTSSMATTHVKLPEKSPDVHSSTANRRNSLLRSSTLVVAPSTTPSPKKIEKDIIKHASRIRTSQLKDYFTRHPNPFISSGNEFLVSVSNSPTRVNNSKKRTKTIKPSKSISLEPLELLLAPAPRPLPPPPPPRATSLPLHDFSTINHYNNQKNLKSSTKRSLKSPKISFVESNTNTPDRMTTNFYLNERSNSSLSNDERISLMKTSPLDIITNDKIRQSNSCDSGCYDRSSSSGDTHSVISFSINPISSVPSARLTSASTRRSNVTKKVSFEDQSSTVIVTSATYV